MDDRTGVAVPATLEDLGWDAVWDAAVSRDASGWTAEFRIPLSQLRFSADAGA